IRAIEVGIELVGDLKKQGYGLIATGEMGIGNTTTSSAVVSVLLGRAPGEVTGRGAGLTSEGLSRKIAAIQRAVAVNQPDAADGIEVLSKVGGLDLAGLAGVFLGGALYHVPVLVDGFISATAALAAATICPAAKDYMLGSHASKEPAGKLVLDALGLQPFLYAEMCLGEGTGAVAVMPLLDLGLALYNDLAT
ncbi:MAG: nicotinate-nucleotide--dimethylbenzimidazole phosphoribosyltransferase, partial [Oscillospiraceae bacterium]